VRDALLHLPVTERDWVVVGASAEEMLAAGFAQLDPEFPVFVHPHSGEEYALARRETKVADGYRGFVVDTAPDVTLQEDLARRDLTINAIAQAQDGGLIDPFDGQADLQQGLLRHITPAFAEDPLRILRVARFAAKLGSGFRVAHATHRLMKRMVSEGAMAQLQPQRIWQEMYKALGYEHAWRFFEVLQACGALQALMPSLAAAMGGTPHADQRECAALAALRRACALSPAPEVRLAALLLQSGELPHELAGRIALSRQAADLTQAAAAAWQQLQALDLHDAAAVVSFLGAIRAWQQGARCEQVLLALQAQLPQAQTIDYLRAARRAAQAVSVQSLQQQGLQGRELGAALAQARAAAVAALC